MTALIEDEASDLPALIREECRDLLAQIAQKTARIPLLLQNPKFLVGYDAEVV